MGNALQRMRLPRTTGLREGGAVGGDAPLFDGDGERLRRAFELVDAHDGAVIERAADSIDFALGRVLAGKGGACECGSGGIELELENVGIDIGDGAGRPRRIEGGIVSGHEVEGEAETLVEAHREGVLARTPGDACGEVLVSNVDHVDVLAEEYLGRDVIGESEDAVLPDGVLPSGGRGVPGETDTATAGDGFGGVGLIRSRQSEIAGIGGRSGIELDGAAGGAVLDEAVAAHGAFAESDESGSSAGYARTPGEGLLDAVVRPIFRFDRNAAKEELMAGGVIGIGREDGDCLGDPRGIGGPEEAVADLHAIAAGMVAGIGSKLFELARGFKSFDSGVAANAVVFLHELPPRSVWIRAMRPMGVMTRR